DVHRIELTGVRSRLARAAALAVPVLAWAAWSPTAHADFSVSPTVVDVRRAPGESTVGTFTVHLRGERGRRFAIAVEDVGQDRRGAFTFGPPGRSRVSAARWIALSPRGFGGGP